MGATLAFVDPAAENQRTAYSPPWRGQLVPPGDTLRAVVPPAMQMRIKYRREARLGVFERREITIGGGP